MSTEETTLDHPRIRKLIQDGALAAQVMLPSSARDLIAHLTDALAEVHEIAVGADHTAAKYWRRVTEAEAERDKAITAGERILADATTIRAERDRYRDAIEEAIASDDSYGHMYRITLGILEAALTDKEAEK